MISSRHACTSQISERSILTQNTGHGEICEGILRIAGEEYQLQYDGTVPRTRGSVLVYSHFVVNTLQFYKVYIRRYSGRDSFVNQVEKRIDGL